jgi:hypothetical protein
MRIEQVNTLKAFRLYDAPLLDPIFIVIHDMGAGSGRLVIECYGDVWSGYWGAMGDNTVEQFLLSCSADYIAGKMFGRHHKRNKHSEGYLLRLVKAVQTALRPVPQHGAGDA